jgi:hypothetical protein
VRVAVVTAQCPLEKDIQSSICQYLDFRKHFWWRNNSGAFKTEHGAFVRFGTIGSPDLIVVHVGRPYFLEVKRPGTYLSVANSGNIAFQALDVGLAVAREEMKFLALPLAHEQSGVVVL